MSLYILLSPRLASARTYFVLATLITLSTILPSPRGVVLGSVTEGTLGQSEVSAYYEHSEDGSYLARIELGDFETKTASVMLFKWNPKSRSVDKLHEFALPNRYRPNSSIITAEGRFFVTVGDFSGGDDLENAVVVHDNAANTTHAFPLDKIIDRSQIAGKWSGYKTDAMVYRRHYLHWFDSVHLDNRNNKIYVSGHSEVGARPAHDYVIDPIEPSVKPLDGDYWKAEYDRQLAVKLKDSEQLGKMLSNNEQYLMFTKLRSTIMPPIIRYRSLVEASDHEDLVDENLVFRMEPGNGEKFASFVVLAWDKGSGTFVPRHDVVLRNPVAASEFVLTPNARFLVTFDDYDKIGLGERAIVIYDLESGKVRSFSLEDFMTPEEIARLSQVSNVRLWRDEYANSIEMPTARFAGTLPSKGKSEYCPIVKIDPEKFEVSLAEPFQPTRKGTGTGGR